MKGRIFITVIGLALMLVSVNASAQDQYTSSVNIPFKSNGIEMNWPKFDLIPQGYVKADGAGSVSGASNKVAMIDCTHPHGLVQIAQAILPFYQTYAAMSVYNSQIEADRAIALQDIISTNETNQLFYNGALSSPWAPYILGSFGSNGSSGMYGFGSYGNSSYGAYSAGVSNARWN